MPTIRVRDWTKERIAEIREAESHSSHDSVIKSLLKDRQLVEHVDESPEPPVESETAAPDAAFDDLTVLAELGDADNGVLFLWCPNCGNELAHVTADSPAGISVFEIECQRCLTHLDQHAIVAIEIGYPIEQKLVADRVEADLRECVVDYWDRRLKSAGPDDDADHLVWQFDQYLREFAWEWPAQVPVVGVTTGTTYRDTDTDQYVEVVEPVTENRNAVDSYEIRRHSDGADDGETAVLDGDTLVEHVADRRLVLAERPESPPDTESTEPSP